MLSAEEIAELRAMQEASMLDEVTIHRKTLTANGAGWDTADSERVTKCRVVLPRTNAQERETAALPGAKQLYVVVLPAGTDVRKADELEVVDHLSAETRWFTVINPIGRSLETARRVSCMEKGA